MASARAPRRRRRLAVRCTERRLLVDAARILLCARAKSPDCAPNLPIARQITHNICFVCHFSPSPQSPPPLHAITESRPFHLQPCLAGWHRRGRPLYLRRARRRQQQRRRGRLRRRQVQQRAELLVEAARPQHPTSSASATARQWRSSDSEAARLLQPTPPQVLFILNPWETASIFHQSMADKATQLDLVLLALHMADLVAPSVQVPLHLGINPVGILHDDENDDTEELLERPIRQKPAKKAAKNKSKGSNLDDDGKSKESAIDVEKLDKFSKIQEDLNANRMKVLELQQNLSTEKLETTRLAHLTAQETKEAKRLEKESQMMQAYNSLISQDTSSMSDDEKAERVAAMKCLRKTLFPEMI